jgi:hypothetical protein
MTQRSWYWGGTSLGDAALPAPYGAPYTDDMFSDVFAMLLSMDRTTQGVVPSERTGFDGLLEVTNPTGTTISVDTGIALVDGKVFASDANESFTTSGDGTYYAVVRKSWAAQTARLALVTSVVQTDGVTWDLPLATIVVSGGTHTVTDTRVFLGGGPTIIRKAGSTVYYPTRVLIQHGLSAYVNESSNSAAITFPEEFSEIPEVFASLRPYGTAVGVWSPYIHTVTTTGCIIQFRDATGTAHFGFWQASWLAIGKRI